MKRSIKSIDPITTSHNAGMEYMRRGFVLFLFIWSLLISSHAQGYDIGLPLTDSICVINKNYDLKGGTIVIPKSCKLIFEKGCLKNGIIVGQNTSIEADLSQIFENVHIRGTWRVPVIYDTWFSHSKESSAILNCINLSTDDIDNVIVVDGNYKVYYQGSNDINPIKSNTTFILNGALSLESVEKERYSILSIIGKTNVTVKGSGKIVGDVETHKGNTGEFGMGIKVGGSTNVTIENVSIEKCWGDGIYITAGYYPIPKNVDGDCHHVLIRNVTIDSNRRNNLTIESGIDVLVENCTINNAGQIHGTSPKYGIDIEPLETFNVEDVTIRGCSFLGNVGGAILSSNSSKRKGVYGNVCLTNMSTDENITIWNSKLSIDSCKIKSLSLYTAGSSKVVNSEVKVVNNIDKGRVCFSNSIVSIDNNKLLNVEANNCIFPYFSVGSQISNVFIRDSKFFNYYKDAIGQLVNFSYGNMGINMSFDNCVFTKDNLCGKLISHRLVPSEGSNINYNNCEFFVNDNSELDFQSVTLNNSRIKGNSRIVFNSRQGCINTIKGCVIVASDVGMVDNAGSYNCSNNTIMITGNNVVLHSIKSDNAKKNLYISGNSTNRDFRDKDIVDGSSKQNIVTKKRMKFRGGKWK